MATWREKLLTKFAPPLPLCGMTAGQWRKLLWANNAEIDAPYRMRGASITASSVVNTAIAWFENRVYGPKVASAIIERPLFILGHWRTGTTHLHNLLSLDHRFAYPNTYQVSYPNTFLTTEATSSRIGAVFLPAKRPMDDVRVSFQAPNEDEFALCGMTSCSPYVGLIFPRHRGRYDRFLSFRDVPEDVIAQWKAALTQFLRKLTWKYGRPLVLKSPPHTCRIRLLLELFPDARFVHIHRNPYHVFQSTCHWLRTAAPWWNLQRPDFTDLESRVLRICREMYDIFFEECLRIPPGRLHEIAYEDLETNPVAELRSLYESLDLPDFDAVEPTLRQYLGSLSDYRKNALPELPPAVRNRIAAEWGQCFKAWSYPT